MLSRGLLVYWGDGRHTTRKKQRVANAGREHEVKEGFLLEGTLGQGRRSVVSGLVGQVCPGNEDTAEGV